MALYGHRIEASLRNYIGHPSSEQLRAYSDIISDELSRRPHQSHQPSATAQSSRAIFLTVIRSLNTRLEQFVFYWSCEKKLACFYERSVGPDFTEHFTFRLCMKTNKLKDSDWLVLACFLRVY